MNWNDLLKMFLENDGLLYVFILVVIILTRRKSDAKATSRRDEES
jgi:hypothetical protein